MTLSQHIGIFEAYSLQAMGWPAREWIVLLDGDDDMPSRINRAKVIAGPYAIVTESDFVGCDASTHSPNYSLDGIQDFLFGRVLAPYQVIVERPDFPVLSA